jgi:hypothetical protein
MSDDRRFERAARSWLELGPAEAPDHAVEAALLAIESTPQERDIRIPWRRLRMTPPLRLATIAVIAALAIGGGLILGLNPRSQVGSPSPGPSTSSGALAPFETTGPGSAAFAAALQSRWVSGGPSGDTMVIGPTYVRIWAFKADIVNAWSVSSPDRRLSVRMSSSERTLTANHWDCRPGQDGSYSVALGAGGATLTIAKISDPCDTRAGILAGAWTRTPCETTDDRCNELAAGHHDSSVLLPGDTPASPIITGLSYVVPTGWTSEQLGDGTLFRLSDNVGINLRVDLGGRSQNPGCPNVGRSVVTTAHELAASMQAFPGLTTTTPVPVTVGGYAGLMLDLSYDPAAVGGCRDPGSAPAIFAFRMQNDQSTSLLPTFYEADDHSRYLLLDLPDGHTLLIEVACPDQASFDDFVPVAMPIINSLQFNPPGLP